MKKITALALITLLLIPFSFAEHNQEEKDTNYNIIQSIINGIVDKIDTIPEKLFSFLLGVINAPIQPLVGLVRDQIGGTVNIDMFRSLWAIIVYIISMFYGLFILFAGISMMTAGHSAVKREQSKQWLKNSLLMIIFVQASFFLYSLVLEASATLSSGIIEMIDPNFFLLTLDNFININLQFFLALTYLAVLLLTALLLGLRYLLVMFGVIFFPLGIFLNFIPPLKSYGQLVINILGVVIFLPFIHALILLATSLITDVSYFANFKIVLMTSSFMLIDLSMLLLLLMAVVKSAFGVLRSDAGRLTAMAVKGA